MEEQKEEEERWGRGNVHVHLCTLVLAMTCRG